MATSDQILSAAQRQAAGEQLSGADETMANLVNSAANPELPEEVRGQWANMPVEERSRHLGSLIDSKRGGSTAPVERATQSNTERSTAMSVDSGRTQEQRDQYTNEGWSVPTDPMAEWIVPTLPARDLGLSRQTKAQNLSDAAMLKSINEGSPLHQILAGLYQNGNMEDSKSTVQDAAAEYQITEQNIAKDHYNRQLMGEIEDPEELADQAEAVSRFTRARQEDQIETARTMIQALGVEEDAEGIFTSLNGNLAMYRVVQEAADEVGIGDDIWDIARTFVFGSLKDNISLSGLSGIAGSEDYFVKLKAGLDNTAPKDRAAALSVINEELKELLPDRQRVRALQILASPTAGTDAADSFGAFDPLMDAAELAVLLTGVGAAAYGGFKGVKALSKVGGKAEETAETIAVGAAAREKAALDAIGMDNDSLTSTMDPFMGEWIDREALDGLSPEIRNRVLEFERSAQDLNIGLVNDESFIREGWLTKQEEEVARRNITKRLEKEQDVDNVTTRREGDSIIATFDVKQETEITLRDAAGEPLRDGNDNIITETRTEVVQQEQEFLLKLDEDTQEIVLADPGLVKRHLTAKGVWATEDFREVVRSAERLDLAEAKVLDDFRVLWQQALEPLTGKGFKGFIKTFTPKQRKKIQALDKLLMDGDEAGKVYTVSELRAGVNGFKPDDDVIEAYYNTRNVIDGLWYARNAELRKELVLKGNKNWTSNVGGKDHIAKTMSDANAARNSFNTNKPTFIYDDVEAGDLLEVADLDLDELYAQGKMIVKLDKPTALSQYADEVSYAITYSDNISELPMEVLKYRAGYVPKLNENVGHVVKIAKARQIDGTRHAAGSRVATNSAEAVRFFDSKKEADIWVDQQNAKMVEEGGNLNDTMYIRVADRQLEKERSVTALSSDGGSAFSGGLYTGSRSSREILYGAEGTKPTRVNAYESISRAMTATSRYVSRNEWRLGQEQRILKTANQLFAGEHSPLDEPFRSFSDLAKVKADTEAGRKVKAMYDSMADWLNFPTSEELLFKESMQRILDNSGMLTKLPGMRKGLHVLKSKDPVGAARSAAFHSLLGFWNPVQLWVQAQGAAVAMSMNIFNPKQFARVMRDQQFIHTMQYVARDSKNFKHWAKAFGKSEDEARELITLWDKTGLQQSVLTTADHSAAEAGYGITMGALRGAADKGLFFYRGGELFNRRLSFMTAYHEWKTANKGMAVDDEALKGILSRSNNFMLNMGKAQRATWQKGILGVATQFQQINMRILETLVGANGNFTWPERGKMMLGQFALYGAAGIPLSSMGMQYLMEMRGYTDQAALENDLGPEVIKAANEGFLGWATLQILGADVEVGDRSSLLGGIRRTANDFMFTEGTLADKLFGAFGNTSSRFWSTLTGTYKPLSLGLAENRAIDPVLMMATPLISSISSMRNVDKAIFMHNMHRILGSNNTTMIRKDFSIFEELGVAIGFRLNQEADIWKVDARNRAVREYEKSVANIIVGMYNQYALKSVAGQITPEYTRQFENDMAVLMQAVDPNGFGQARVSEMVQKKLQDTSTKEYEVWEEFMNLTEGRLAHEMVDVDKFTKSPAAYLQGIAVGGDILTRRQFQEEDNGEEE